MELLGGRGERDAGGTNGEGPVRKRKPKRPEQVAARLAECRHIEGIQPERARFQQGVQPLNAGFSELEQMRARTVAGAKQKLKGTR